MLFIVNNIIYQKACEFVSAYISTRLQSVKTLEIKTPMKRRALKKVKSD